MTKPEIRKTNTMLPDAPVTQVELPRGDRESRRDPEVRGDLRGGGQDAGRRLQVLPGPGAHFE